MDSWEQLKSECMTCRGCELCRGRHNVVFGDGNPAADIMLVGEGPGEQEDLRGLPFVGPAGQLLDDMLELIDLNRENVYIANVVKCRPPQNRDPRPEEQAACRKWLDRQIELVNPKMLVLVGRIAAAALTGEDIRITQDHGKDYEVCGRPAVVLYHPSFLLRDQSRRPETFVDLKHIQQELKKLT